MAKKKLRDMGLFRRKNMVYTPIRGVKEAIQVCVMIFNTSYLDVDFYC